MQAPQDRSDGEGLVAARRAQDPRAMFALLARHADSAHRLARVLAGPQDADDLTQETLARAFARADNFDPARGSLRAWVLGMTRLIAFERQRQRRRWVATDDEEGSCFDLAVGAGFGTASPEQALSQAESREHLTRALALLDAGDRELIVFRDLEGLSGDEVANALGISLAAQKSRLHRARLRLLTHLRALEEGTMPEDRDIGGMTCSAVLQVLSEYVDGELDAQARLRVERHVSACAVCEKFGGRFAHVVGEMRQHLGAPPAVSEQLLEALRARLALT